MDKEIEELIESVYRDESNRIELSSGDGVHQTLLFGSFESRVKALLKIEHGFDVNEARELIEEFKRTNDYYIMDQI